MILTRMDHKVDLSGRQRQAAIRPFRITVCRPASPNKAPAASVMSVGLPTQNDQISLKLPGELSCALEDRHVGFRLRSVVKPLDTVRDSELTVVQPCNLRRR